MWCSDDEYLWQMMLKEEDKKRKAAEAARPIGTTTWAIYYKRGDEYGFRYNTEEEARKYIENTNLTYRKEIWNGKKWEA